MASNFSSMVVRPKSEVPHVARNLGAIPWPSFGVLSRKQVMIQSNESVERIRELLDRNLQKVFGEGDDEQRRAAIGELWAQDGVLYMPPGAIIGHNAIDRFAGDLRATHSHYVYIPLGKPQVLHNAGRLSTRPVPDIGGTAGRHETR
jgi:hypothetical protein